MLDSSKYKPLIYLEQDDANRLVDFLKYNNVDSACIEYDEELVSYAVCVLLDDEVTATPLVKAFKASEIETAIDNGNESVDDNNFVNSKSPSSVYENKSNKYAELRSSGIALIVFTFLGAIYMLLNMVGILHLNSGAMFYIVFSALLLVFLYGGINSLTSAKKIKEDASKEADLTITIKEWFKTTYKQEYIDNAINEQDLPDEVLFFKRTQKIKDLITAKYNDLDEAFVDNLCEELLEELY